MTDSLDTNLVVHFILREPEAQADQVWDLLNSGDHHHLADLVVTETVYVFEKHYGQARSDIVHNLQSFFARFDDVLDYNRKLFALALPYYVAHPALSFNDCYLAFDAELAYAEPLWTFNRRLAAEHPSAKRVGQP